MDKIIQEFRIIETDDGFRIEIKGDKEQLRDFVMHLDPRRWAHHGPPPFGFGPHMWRGRFRRGPFAFAWGWGEDDDEEEEEHPRHKRGHAHHHAHDDEDEGVV